MQSAWAGLDWDWDDQVLPLQAAGRELAASTGPAVPLSGLALIRSGDKASLEVLQATSDL